MIEAGYIIFFTALYLTVLFYIAYQGDKTAEDTESRFQPVIYALSLTVYCTSWTFYGAVGNAAESGLSYFTIYLGPVLVFIFFFPFIKRIISVSKKHKITSIADFIGTRYGKSTRLSALVTIIAFVGTMPYIALQIKAIANAYDTITGTSSNVSFSPLTDTAFAVTIILAVFSILFGARTIDASQHHRGLIRAIGFESIVKLIAFLSIAILAYNLIDSIASNNTQLYSTTSLLLAPFDSFQPSAELLTKTLLAAGAIFLLPRQFHVLAVEARGGENLSRWALPLYLLLFSLAVVPIAAAGKVFFSGTENTDLYVLLLPMFEEQNFLSVLSYLGGFSAATGMVIVATIALSTMVSNELIFPLLIRYYQGNTHNILLMVRRITILVLMMLAYGFYYVGGTEKSLHSIGLISFAAAIQFLPAVLASVYWHKAHKNGAFAGLLLGFILWIYCLLLPSLIDSAWMPQVFIEVLNDKHFFFNPVQLFGFEFNDQLTHGVFWSLFFNSFAFIYFSLTAQAGLIDRLQAASYIDQNQEIPGSHGKYKFKIQELFELCMRFTGEKRSREYFLEHGYDINKIVTQPADDRFQDLSERLLASSIGSAAAEHLIRSAAISEQSGQQHLYGFIDQTGQAIEFNRELLQVTLDHIGQAVSVVDADLRLILWNRQYLELFDFESGYIRAGKAIEEVIRYNQKRGYGPALAEALEKRIQKRLGFLRNGKHYTFIRTWKDGRIIQTEGARMPDGGYITTYTDITPLKQAEKRLEAINETLEAKVEERTEMLSKVNKQLEAVINSKTHFLAAASHDLIQPLSASKLYLGSLLEDLSEDKEKQQLAKNSLNALTTAESLLKSLLHLSKLDSAVLIPEIKPLKIQSLFKEIENEFLLLAKQRGLCFRVISAADKMTLSDQSLLLSILQNLVANAVRYTENGTIVLLCRYCSTSEYAIEVRDSGPGIPLDRQDEIFQPFKQLQKKKQQGVGLGLAISRQAALLLGHQLTLRSAPGKGSTFRLIVPLQKRDNNDIVQINDVRSYALSQRRWMENIRVLCVDDDREILKASRTLLERWGANMSCVDSAEQYYHILENGPGFDIILMDYQLGENKNGLDLLVDYQHYHHNSVIAVLVTAEQNQRLLQQAQKLGFEFLAKPVEPAKLRSLLQFKLNSQ